MNFRTPLGLFGMMAIVCAPQLVLADSLGELTTGVSARTNDSSIRFPTKY